MKKTHASFATLFALALTASLSNSALANERPDRHQDGVHRDHVRKNIDHRQHHQRERIKQGVRSGELTGTEAKGLVTEQREIRQQERAYRSDGEFTKAERKDVQQDLNNSSKNIYQEKHDSEKRF